MTTRQRGRLVKWNDSRGYGFIEPQDSGPDVFVHISSFPKDGRRPAEGDEIFFQLAPDSDKPKAETARLTGLTPAQQSIVAFSLSGSVAGVFISHLLGFLRLPLPALVYLFMSLLTFGFYWADKRRAENAQWRLTETTLHVLHILGGWPGALLAQYALRHKTRKPSFQSFFWIIIAVHVAVWAVWIFLG